MYKPHSIGESLVLPAAIGMAEAVFGKSRKRELRKIPLLEISVGRIISDTLENRRDQIIN
jgi:hypothetical protein